MTLQEAFRQQFAIFYDTAAANLAGMTQEQSLAQPAQGGNCANWILGHLVNVHNQLMRLLNEKPVWEGEQLARAGFEPITSAANAIDWELLRDAFLDSRERCLNALARLTDAEVEEDGLPHPFGGTATRAELLTLLAFHQTYHVGQLAVARRVAGLEGVIKGPGQSNSPVRRPSRSTTDRVSVAS